MLLVAFTIIAICSLDRPFSTAAHGFPEPLKVFGRALTHIVDPLPVLAVVAAVVVAWTPQRLPICYRRLIISAVVAILLTIVVKEQAKFAFGRLWPETWVDGNPSWIGMGRYGFEPFHGGRGWASFPSGHMVLVSAPAIVLGRVGPRCRAVALLLVAAVAVGLLLANYHFLGDVAGGATLGAICGRVAIRLTTALDACPGTPISDGSQS